MFNSSIKSLFDLQTRFPDEQSCIDYLTEIRWNGIPVSPFDPSAKVYKCKNNLYRCAKTRKLFNVKTQTLFDNTKISLRKWYMAIWLLTSDKKGVPSTLLAKQIDVTQKTAWFMTQRIRACFGIENYNLLEDTVESDETFYGGRNRNRHKDKKVANSQGRSFKDKTPVLGLLQRDGKITALVVPNTKQNTLQPLIKKYVKRHSRFISDEWQGYNGLSSRYDHQQVDHRKKIYVNLEDSSVTTNSIEGFWKIFKNSARDNYNNVSRKHLQFYVDESVYRYNLRKHEDSDKFNWLLYNSGVRTKYKDLIG